MTRLTNEARQIAAGRVRLPGPDGGSLALMRAQGREAEAQAILEDFNAARRRIGAPEFAMPEPIKPAGYYGTVLSHGRKADDLEPKELPNGRFQVAA